MRRIRLLPLMLAAVAALALAACGTKEERVLEGHTEGTYLDIGEMRYQVQISRLLNPDDREDRDYLVGIPAAEQLAEGEAWFAVFIRAQNDTDSAQPLADEYTIHDAQGNEFEPIAVGAENTYAFRPGDVQPNEVYPLLGSAAAESTIQGSMLLFKVPYEDFSNRPLEFEIGNPADPDHPAKVDLDV